MDIDSIRETVRSNAESLSTQQELVEGYSSRAHGHAESQGNNITYIMAGEKLPEQKDMEPYRLYVYQDISDNQLKIASKKAAPRTLDASDEIKSSIKARLQDAAFAEEKPLGSQSNDLRDIAAVMEDANKKQILSKTYYQLGFEAGAAVSNRMKATAKYLDKITGGVVTAGAREVAAPVAAAINIPITLAFGSKKNIKVPDNTIVGRIINPIGKQINNTWEAAKTSPYSAIRLPIKAMDYGVSAVHTVTNSKAASRVVSLACMAGGFVGATIVTGGGFLVAGGVAMAGLTVAGANAEASRENADVKKRHLTDLIAHSEQKEHIIEHINNPQKRDLRAILSLSDSKLQTTEKPKTLDYRATNIGLEVERQVLVNTVANTVSLAADAVSGDFVALGSKAAVTVTNAAATAASKLNEQEVKDGLDHEINKLKSIAPVHDEKELAAQAKRAVIESKALALADKDKDFQDLLVMSTKDSTLEKFHELKIKERFDVLKSQAEKDLDKELSIESDARTRAAKDPKFQKAFEEVQEKPNDPHAIKELRECYEIHEKDAVAAAAKPPTMMSRIGNMFKKDNIYYNNNSTVMKVLKKTGRCFGKELFAGERTSYKAVAASNYLSESSKHLEGHNIIDKYTYGHKEREAVRAQAPQVQVHTQAPQVPSLATPSHPTHSLSMKASLQKHDSGRSNSTGVVEGPSMTLVNPNHQAKSSGRSIAG